ncbi:putative cysteine proteinase, partial [Symbiodinium microadriaticum]
AVSFMVKRKLAKSIIKKLKPGAAAPAEVHSFALLKAALGAECREIPNLISLVSSALKKAMMRRCLLAAALMHQAAAELLCERTGACTRDREEENSILLHTRLYKANVSKHVMKMMNFERPPQDYTFDQYVKDFGKKYDPKSGEYAEREQAFKEALSAVQAHNADASKTYKVAINVYSDWTAEELKSLRGLKKMKREASAFKVKSLHLSKDEEYPQKVDWRE